MSISFSGVSSGLPVNDIIEKLMAIERRPITLLQQRKDKITAEQAQYAAISTRVSDLRSMLTKLTDARLGINSDLFEAKTATSSNTSAVTVSVTNSATKGSFQVSVLSLATATKANSTDTVGTLTTGASVVNTVAEGSITSGDFTVYINNQAKTITVDKDNDTVQDVIDRVATEIANVTGQAASGTVLADGKIEFSFDPGTNIQFGAATDTSNFAKQTYLTTGSTNMGGGDRFTAQYATSTLKKSGKLIGNEVGFQTNNIVAGTFTIGTETFTIDADTTLQDLMADINNSTKAGVSVSYNRTTNKIEMVSKSTGNQAIFMDDNGTGFLEAVKLVNGGDSLSSQTMGNNAQIQINGGSTLESTSNTVDSSVTGLTGVTLTLLNTTGATPATIEVKQDTEKLKTGIKDVLTKFNALVSFLDEQTKKGAVLNKENMLIRFRQEVRTIMSDRVSGLNTYNSLSTVGISTGSVVSNPAQGSVPSSTFSMDETKFLAALEANPEEVKKLFIGDGAAVEGIFNQLEDKVVQSLDPEYGLFSSRDKSANDQIKSINDAIDRAQKRLEKKEKQLRAEFTAMEKLITAFQQQQSALAGLNNQLLAQRR